MNTDLFHLPGCVALFNYGISVLVLNTTLAQQTAVRDFPA